MKRSYFILVLMLLAVVGNAQIINFPDANFKARLLESNETNGIAKDINGVSIIIDTNSDNEIQVSEALVVYNLQVGSNLNDPHITDLTGIQNFTNLRVFDCSGNAISSIDVSNLSLLEDLNFDNSQVTSVNFGNLVNLKFLAFAANQLTSVDLSGLVNLESLQCSFNQIQELNLAGLNHIIGLYCTDNQLSSLDVTGLNNLYDIWCANNQIASLNLTGITTMHELYCDNNQLTSLNVAGLNNLIELNCSFNQLATLDVDGLIHLEDIYANSNQLTTIDLSSLVNLNFFDVSDNQLISLFMKNGRANGSDTLFSGNPNLQYVCVEDEYNDYVQSHLLDYGNTNCVVNSYCNFTPGGTFYTIHGSQKFDANNDGCDSGDIPFPNLKLIAAGVTSITLNDSGSYHYEVQGPTTVTPVLENPTYFMVSPASVVVNFPTDVSPFEQNFCVAPNGVHNDLEVVVIPNGNAAPGFNTNYWVIFKNKGTNTQSGTLNLTFEGDRLDYVTSDIPVSNATENSLEWNFIDLKPFETRYFTIVLNVNSPMETPPVNSGDILSYTMNIIGAIDETPEDNTLTFNQNVVNSFDPNDKTCLEGNVISPSMVGEYVHYMIRFENTGTANAHNIVVKDIIDTTKFDINTLVPITGSGSYITRIINDNQVEFIFENINLPFDDTHNDGYVAFKIKTLPSLVEGDTFSNNANIYFDYNAPIVTNTATTTVQTLGTSDFDFGTIFTLTPIPAKNVLTISTKQLVTLSSVSIYNTLGQLIQVETNPNLTIDVSSLKSGSYFIKITSDKGTSSSKFIKE